MRSYCSFCAKLVRKAEKLYFRETVKQIFFKKHSLILNDFGKNLVGSINFVDLFSSDGQNSIFKIVFIF